MLPAVDKLVAEFDDQRQAVVDKALGRLWKAHGLEALIPGFVAAYPRIKSWRGRNVILFTLIRLARKCPEVVDLALAGLRDRAYLVRMQACAILVYSLRRDAIPPLEELLRHRNQETRADAAAAIDAIKRRNHNYWVDRDHSGNVGWTVNPEDELRRTKRRT
jgi:hypothetical protein